MERTILLFWRQSRGGVLMFAAGPTLEKGQLLQLAFGDAQQYAYSVATIYHPEAPAALIEQYYNIWEEVLDPAQVSEIRAGIQRVRSNAGVLAYLLKLETAVAPKPRKPTPGSPVNN